MKLEPSFVEAWNELGESYWKREDVDNARICFEGALVHRENKIRYVLNVCVCLKPVPMLQSREGAYVV